jgi:hypothetical protein
VIVVDEELIRQLVVVEYDRLPYPGEILDVYENDVEVKVYSLSKAYYFGFLTYSDKNYMYYYLYN